MAYDPNIKSNAQGDVTVTGGLTATQLNTPALVTDPTVAPVLTAVAPTGTDDNGNPYVALPAGTYYVSYAWKSDQFGLTSTSPEPHIVLDGTKALKITLPVTPEHVIETDVYSSNGMNFDVRDISVSTASTDGANLAHPLIDQSTFTGYGFAPQGNGTGALSTVEAPMQIDGPAIVGNTLNVWDSIQANHGTSEWGNQPPTVQPEITGTLTSATLPQLTAILSQILVALDVKGTVKNSTT